jgi:hypothetical protein
MDWYRRVYREGCAVVAGLFVLHADDPDVLGFRRARVAVQSTGMTLRGQIVWLKKHDGIWRLFKTARAAAIFSTAWDR